MNLKSDSAAVAYSKAWKKLTVRALELLYRLMLANCSSPISQGIENLRLTLSVNVLNELLVIATASSAFEKIHALTSFVRKLLYESSSVFFSTTFGATYGAKARLTVASKALSISACGLSGSSITAALPSSPLVVFAEGSASALSDPLVPQDTSCQLQYA